LDQILDVEIVGIANSQRAALNQIEISLPDLILVDLMLPDNRSIDLISQVSDNHPEVHFLAISPGDIPHDQIILAIHAGALGFITRDAEFDRFAEAIQAVHRGQHWLPLEETYEVLGDAAVELSVTAEELRARLGQVILGLIPLTGMIAALTAYLWRQYWGQIGVRVVDLGIDPTTRMIDVVLVILLIIGEFGPLLFVRDWIEAIRNWIENNHPALTGWVVKVRQRRLGRLVFNLWVARLLMAIVLLFFLVLINQTFPLIMAIFIGPAVGVILLANLLDLDQELPKALRFPHLGTRRVVIFFTIVIILFLMVVGTEVMTTGPDLRTDGLHGILAPEVLGLRARPIILHDLDGNLEPLGALYLGGNADLYVLYDPCAETVRLVPVGSSRVEMVDEVICP
jgi:CheY-like chemotaxis protein